MAKSLDYQPSEKPSEKPSNKLTDRELMWILFGFSFAFMPFTAFFLLDGFFRNYFPLTGAVLAGVSGGLLFLGALILRTL